jgi:poly(A) polymerase
MSASVADAPWLTAPHVVAVLDALEAEGGPDCARFVGGCVRNALIGAPVDDIDLATQLTPERTTAALERGGLRAVPTGIEHGTVTAVVDHQPVEVTTLRRDVETDGRRAVVAFTTDWKADAERRDFRLNALYADRRGHVYEPAPGGVADARAGRIVFVGDPETRIREDYLRILRFFRFGAWYGRDWPDEAGLAACARLKDGLGTLSAERVGKELLKLLAAPDPWPAVSWMGRTGVLSAILPDLGRLDWFETGCSLTADPELRLSLLIKPDPERARRTADRLRLSNAQKARILAAVEPQVPVHPGMGPAAAAAALYRLGAPTFRDRLIRAWAERPEAAAEARELLRLAENWNRPRFPLSGEDALALGASGPAIGRALRAVEADWAAGGFAKDRAALLDRLAAQLRS